MSGFAVAGRKTAAARGGSGKLGEEWGGMPGQPALAGLNPCRRPLCDALGLRPDEPFGNAEDEHLETLPALKGGRPRRILAGKVSGAQGATAFVLFDPDLALG